MGSFSRSHLIDLTMSIICPRPNKFLAQLISILMCAGNPTRVVRTRCRIKIRAMHNDMTLEDETGLDELTPGVSLLHGQYVIEEYLVRGGFGITYLARDSLDRQVVIKECFPGAICCRAGSIVQSRNNDQAGLYASIVRHFLHEARRLAKLTHPNIVGVHQVFEENGTAYMAMDYVEGVDLLTMLEEDENKLTPDMIRDTLRNALVAISYIHKQGILHRDISPDNFLLGPNNELTLIDFGAAREHAGRETRALSALVAVKDGYSPHEFYLADVKQCASSDLYSLAATFYHLITGFAPPYSQERLAAVAGNQPDPYVPLVSKTKGFDVTFLSAIDQALSVLAKDRIQTADEWLATLAAAPVAPVIDTSGQLSRELRLAISRLVEKTNKGIKRGQPGLARAEATRKENGVFRPVIAEQKAEKPSKPVDIFGNPIDDIEAWLRDQDRRTRAVRVSVAFPETIKTENNAPLRPGTDADKANAELSKMFSGRFMSRRSPLTTEFQN